MSPNDQLSDRRAANVARKVNVQTVHNRQPQSLWAVRCSALLCLVYLQLCNHPARVIKCKAIKANAATKPMLNKNDPQW